jgi:hypothetical protein
MKQKNGRPAVLTGGKRVLVYLDDDSLSQAWWLGESNISAGVRAALRTVAEISERERRDGVNGTPSPDHDPANH